MCIRDRGFVRQAHSTQNLGRRVVNEQRAFRRANPGLLNPCLLYTSDAADERSSVDLGGRRIIKKKQTDKTSDARTTIPPPDV